AGWSAGDAGRAAGSRCRTAARAAGVGHGGAAATVSTDVRCLCPSRPAPSQLHGKPSPLLALRIWPPRIIHLTAARTISTFVKGVIQCNTRFMSPFGLRADIKVLYRYVAPLAGSGRTMHWPPWMNSSRTSSWSLRFLTSRWRQQHLQGGSEPTQNLLGALRRPVLVRAIGPSGAEPNTSS